tara:strand:+ start:5872 stop:7263 length:1392 start_codon:yes stop_codon:yes gene_type:complete
MDERRICLQAGNIEMPDDTNLNSIKVVLGTSKDWSGHIASFYFSDDALGNVAVDRSEVNEYSELEFQRCLEFVISHQATRVIYERGYTLKGIVFADADIERITYNAYVVLLKYKIDTFISHNTPHQLIYHIFGLVAKFLKIPTYSIRDSVMMWRVTLEKDLIWGKQIRLNYAEQNAHFNLSDVEDFIKSKSQSYDKAVTEFEGAMLNRYKSKGYPDKLIWRDFLTDLKVKGLARAAKSALYKREVSHSFLLNSVHKTDNRINHDNYALFYMHYQPERTTLPEGGIYNQQLLAIRSLRRYLPNEMSIVVKEHPATFRHRLNSKYRNANFYHELAEIENTFLINDLKNDFGLLDRAKFVSSVKGTVLIEAAIRGKCGVYFGNPSYKGLPGSFYINELPDIKVFLSLCEGASERIAKEANEYLRDQYSITVGSEVVGPDKFSNEKEYWKSSKLLLSFILSNQNCLD